MNTKQEFVESGLNPAGTKTILVERKFDENTKPNREAGEPLVALCGFDSAAPRAILEKVGFDVIVEAGLGKDVAGFDDIRLHTFPNSTKSAEKLWAIEVIDTENDLLREKFEYLGYGCGIVATTIAKKAISASFVGALTGALAIAEVIRGYNNGLRTEKISLRIRSLKIPMVDIHPTNIWRGDFALNGYVSAC